MGKAIDAFVPFPTTADFSRQVVWIVCHELLNFRAQSLIVSRQFCLDQSINFVNGQLGTKLKKKKLNRLSEKTV